MIFSCLLLGLAANPEVPIERLAILPAVVPGPYGQANLEALHASLSEAASMRLGLTVASYHEIQVDGAETIAAAIRTCGSDPDCAARALRLSGYQLGLQVISNFALDPPLITVALIDVAAGNNAGEVVVELSTGEPIGERVAKEAAILLDQTQHRRGGRVVVEVTPQDSTVVLAGARPTPGARHDYTLLPGRYRLEVLHDGYVSDTREVEVVAGQAQAVVVQLSPVVVEEVSLFASPWFWGALGVVAVGAATATVLVVTQEPTPNCLCVGAAGGACGGCF